MLKLLQSLIKQILYEDVVTGLYNSKISIPTVNYVYGIGGRDTKSDDIEKVFNDLSEIVRDGKVENHYRYLGVRGDK